MNVCVCKFLSGQHIHRKTTRYKLFFKKNFLYVSHYDKQLCNMNLVCRSSLHLLSIQFHPLVLMASTDRDFQFPFNLVQYTRKIENRQVVELTRIRTEFERNICVHTDIND